jgi:hypothetical protein
MSCKFKIDKTKSLDIIRNIMATEPKPEDEGLYDDQDEEKTLLYEHNISIIELYIDSTDYYDEIIKNSNEKKKYIEASIDIQKISLNNDNIMLTAYMSGTIYECDWSYCTFIYDPYLKIWIDSLYKESIKSNSVILILDFSYYHKKEKKVIKVK